MYAQSVALSSFTDYFFDFSLTKFLLAIIGILYLNADTNQACSNRKSLISRMPFAPFVLRLLDKVFDLV